MLENKIKNFRESYYQDSGTHHISSNQILEPILSKTWVINELSGGTVVTDFLQWMLWNRITHNSVPWRELFNKMYTKI